MTSLLSYQLQFASLPFFFLFIYHHPLHIHHTQQHNPLLLFPSILFLTHMRVGATSSPHHGKPGYLAAACRRISTVPWLPLGHCPSLDHHLHPQWRPLLLLPLGQDPFPPSIFLSFRSPNAFRFHQI